MTAKKPTAIRKLEGNAGKRALPKNEPNFEVSIPSPPEHLDDLALVEWLRITPQLYNTGVITNADMSTLASYCTCYSRWVKAEIELKKLADGGAEYGGLIVVAANGTLMNNPLIGVANTMMLNAVKFAIELGLTPVARSRVTALQVAEKDNPADKFFNRGVGLKVVR